MTFGRIQVLKTLEAELPPDDSDKGAALHELLLGLRENHGVKDVVIGLEPALFTHTFVDLPVTSRQDIVNSLEFEMEKYLPLPPDEYVYDFHSVKTVSGSSHNMVLSARRDKLLWISEGLRDTGLGLHGLRCTAFEGLSEVMETGKSGSFMFMYQGATSAASVVVKDSEPDSLSFRPLGDAPDKTAREMIEGYEGEVLWAGPEGTASPAVESLVDTGTNVLLSLLKSTGGRRAFSMDFSPGELVRERTNWLPPAIAGLAGACIVVFFLTSLLAYYRDYSALSSVRKRLEEIKATAGEVVEIKRKAESLEQRKRFLMHFRKESNRHIFTLKSLSRILPRDAWLTSFTANESGVVELEGYARRTADIILPLESSSRFMEVEFTTPVTVRKDSERFAIKMKVEK
jgi:Tfp pilus assembly protein PilN